MNEFPNSDKFVPLTEEELVSVSSDGGGGQDDGECVRPELEFVSWGEFTMDAKGLTTSKVWKNGQTAGKEWIASRSFCGSIFKIFWMRHNESDRS